MSLLEETGLGMVLHRRHGQPKEGGSQNWKSTDLPGTRRTTWVMPQGATATEGQIQRGLLKKFSASRSGVLL